jgi:hypothetical protein
MQTFPCVCGNTLFFDNTVCTRCVREVGWCPPCTAVAPIEEGHNAGPGAWGWYWPEGAAWHCALSHCEADLVKCHNYRVEGVCNRLLTVEQAKSRPDPDRPLCDYCQFNEVIPDLSIEGHRERWGRLEAAKRRVFYQLDQLGLPRGTAMDGFNPPLSFDFKTDALPEDAHGQWRPMGGEQVLTGHANGKVTINLKEADDAERQRMQLAMGESYRTLVGHFRHEIGHYYWDVLIRDHPDALAGFKTIFGDPATPDYATALDRHYSQGPPSDWSQKFTTPYATMHPWEDWAETWAAYLELLSTLDTAIHLHLLPRDDQPMPYDRPGPAVDDLLPRYRQLGIGINELNRAMGLSDILTRHFPDPVLRKLRFIDERIRGAKP